MLEDNGDVRFYEMMIWYTLVALALVAALFYQAKEAGVSKEKEFQTLDKWTRRLVSLREVAEERLSFGCYPFDNRYGLMAFVSCLYYLESAYKELGARAVAEDNESNIQTMLPVLEKQFQSLTSQRQSATPRLVNSSEAVDESPQKKAG